jgi:hypothetical protein
MGKVIERINGARVITAVFYDGEHKDGGLGYIDFIDDRWNKPRHRFAYINAKDWEHEVTIKNLLSEALLNDNKIDIVVERRQITPKQQFDFIVKVDEVVAFQG